MEYSLEKFCAETRSILQTSDNRDGRELIRQKLEQLLCSDEFCRTYVATQDESGKRQIYSDDETQFCVLVYNMPTDRTSPPHDHGDSWAVYGQAAKHTDMTIWESLPDGSLKLDPLRTFRLNPGEAGLFDVREIHSIQYPAGAKFVRVTGVDMSKETRRVFNPETGAVKETASAGAGTAPTS